MFRYSILIVYNIYIFMINITTLLYMYKIYNFRWKENKDVHILSTWGDVKDPDVKSRFNEETKEKTEHDYRLQ